MSPNALFAKLVLTAGLLCLGLACSSADASPSAFFSAEYIDNKRVLIACPSQTDAYQGILPEVDWDGFNERDLVIVNLAEKDVYMFVPSESEIQSFQLQPNDSTYLRRMSDCRVDDSYVLIGKDGGVKRRWRGQVLVEELFQTIDAMPMRRFEMGRKN